MSSSLSPLQLRGVLTTGSADSKHNVDAQGAIG